MTDSVECFCDVKVHNVNNIGVRQCNKPVINSLKQLCASRMFSQKPVLLSTTTNRQSIDDDKPCRSSSDRLFPTKAYVSSLKITTEADGRWTAQYFETDKTKHCLYKLQICRHSSK